MPLVLLFFCLSILGPWLIIWPGFMAWHWARWARRLGPRAIKSEGEILFANFFPSWNVWSHFSILFQTPRSSWSIVKLKTLKTPLLIGTSAPDHMQNVRYKLLSHMASLWWCTQGPEPRAPTPADSRPAQKYRSQSATPVHPSLLPASGNKPSGVVVETSSPKRPSLFEIPPDSPNRNNTNLPTKKIILNIEILPASYLFPPC